MSLRASLVASSFLGVLAACVPTGSAPPYDGGASPMASNFKPSVNVMAAVFEDNFDRPDAGEGQGPASGDAAVGLLGDGAKPRGDAGHVTRDAALDSSPSPGASSSSSLATGEGPADAAPDADRRPSNLGPNWSETRVNTWRVENGRLCGENAKNHPVWLNKTLPINARIEFDAVALTDDGDLKSEVWGDGHSWATGQSYTMATSYLPILGGWHNTIHSLARLNEHSADRKEIKVDKESDDPRQRAVVRGQLYQFKIERADGKTVKVMVNGLDYFSWADSQPLAGYGHDHFGFNNWESKVCFDNVKVTPLN